MTRPAARPPIDPRIRQRRIEVRRDQGRRRLRVVLAAVAALSLAGCGLAATHSALLDVDRIEVRGTLRATPQQVMAATRLDRHRFMIDVDPAATSRRAETLPWVARAVVTRRFPGTVVITVRERVPLANLPAAQGAIAIVDREGRVLEIAEHAPPGTVAVVGAEPAPGPGQTVAEPTRAAIGVVGAMPPEVRSRLSAATILPAGDVELRLASPAGVIVRIGPPDQLDAKVVALATILAKADLKGLAIIDVRVPGAPTLTRTNAAK